jgi:hypothetical protein
MKNTFRTQNNMSLAETQNFAMGLDTATLKTVFVGDDKFLDEKHFAVWNESKEKVSAIVSDEYKLVQHQHLINEVTNALLNLNLKTKVDVKDGGDVLFADITFTDSKIDVKKGEEFFVSIRVINSYNKQTGIMILPRLVRLVCSNGAIMDAVWKKSFNIAHTNKLAENFTEIIPVMIKEMVEHNDHFKALVERCMEDSVEWEVAQRIIQKLIQTEKHRDAIFNILEKLKEDNRVSIWSIYNSVTDYCSHSDALSPNVERNLQNKAQEILTTPLEKLIPVQIIEGA